MRRFLAAGAVLAIGLTTSGCAVVAGPYDPYYPGYRVVAPTIYPAPYYVRPWTPADQLGAIEQQRWQRWYSCQQYYGNYGRCAY